MPALVRRFTAEMRKQKAEVIAGGREFNRTRKKMGDADAGFLYSANITTAGQSLRLLSLQTAIIHYMGGAHSNYGFDALLWDRRQNRPIDVNSLFLWSGAFQALTRPRFCKALDGERDDRWEGEKLDGEFGDCPKYDRLAIALVDKDRDGKFDGLEFVAAPYTAGPFSEGEYEIAIPVTSKLIRGIKPEFRSSFEVQPQ